MDRARRTLEIIALATLIALGAVKAWSMLAPGGDASTGGGSLDLSGDGLLLMIGLGGLCVVSLAALAMWGLRGHAPAASQPAPDATPEESKPQPLPRAPHARADAQPKWRGHPQARPAVFGRRPER